MDLLKSACEFYDESSLTDLRCRAMFNPTLLNRVKNIEKLYLFLQKYKDEYKNKSISQSKEIFAYKAMLDFYELPFEDKIDYSKLGDDGCLVYLKLFKILCDVSDEIENNFSFLKKIKIKIYQRKLFCFKCLASGY